MPGGMSITVRHPIAVRVDDWGIIGCESVRVNKLNRPSKVIQLLHLEDCRDGPAVKSRWLFQLAPLLTSSCNASSKQLLAACETQCGGFIKNKAQKEVGMRLKGKAALVTGAGSGIGAAIARRFAMEGASVHVTGLHKENTFRITSELRDAGNNAIGRVLDVTDSHEVASAISATVSEFGKLDILVANAALAGMSAYIGPPARYN